LEADALTRRYDTVPLAVLQEEYRELEAEAIGAVLNEGGRVANLKGVAAGVELAPSVSRWTV